MPFVALPMLDPPIHGESPSPEETGNFLESGRFTFRLAKSRGFCHGVERALKLAREAMRSAASRSTWITSPILHNPQINAELRRGGVRFLSDSPSLWDELNPGDLVLLPAFGAPPDLRARLDDRGCTVVDTTCGSVVFVWKSVDRLARDGFTLVYHGTARHEEAVATLSRLSAFRNGSATSAPHVVLENEVQAEALAAFLRGSTDAASLQVAIPNRSIGFDPLKHLERIGLASQTTMLARETLSIERLLRSAMEARFGASELSYRFRAQDTICSATQERQDALVELLSERLDLVIVVGGFTSSNSAHLAELAATRIPTFHIEGPEDILSARAIRHRVASSPKPMVTSDWLPTGCLSVGVTSGASTPEEVVQSVIARIIDAP